LKIYLRKFRKENERTINYNKKILNSLKELEMGMGGDEPFTA
jgi:hypothetical protein